MAISTSSSDDENCQPKPSTSGIANIPTVVVAEANRMTTSRRTGKRGRKPAKVDVKAKLERSRQSARECRARKKLRYQYLEELVTSREKAIYALRKELEMYKQHVHDLDNGILPVDICRLVAEHEEQQMSGAGPS